MRTFILSTLILLSTNLLAQNITRFGSQVDVLVYLNSKSDFTNKDTGVTLTFFEMGGRMKSNKGVSYYNPDVTLLSSTRAVVTYESLTSGGIAKIIVDCKENVIADKSSMTVYAAENYRNENNDQQPERKESKVKRTVKVNAIAIGKLLISKQDIFLEDGKRLWATNFNEVKSACFSLGAGWRLPTKAELLFIYENRTAIGGFETNFYISSTEGKTANNNAGIFSVDFDNGDTGFILKNGGGLVRPVKSK